MVTTLPPGIPRAGRAMVILCPVTSGDIVELPLHLKWGGPRRHDLCDPAQLRCYVDPDVVLDLLPDLVLPERVRSAWLNWAEVTRAREQC